MDLQFRSVASVSSHSQRAFVPGDRVWSMLFLNPKNETERMDVLEAELPDCPLPERILCRWSQIIREPELTEAAANRQSLLSAEEMFLSLYDETEAAESPPSADSADSPLTASRDRLKFFLALQLERKRILRSQSGGRYLHLKSKRSFPVPQLPLTPELFKDLPDLLGGKSTNA